MRSPFCGPCLVWVEDQVVEGVVGVKLGQFEPLHVADEPGGVQLRGADQLERQRRAPALRHICAL